MLTPAQSAKRRKRGPTVTERRLAEEAAAAAAEAARAPASNAEAEEEDEEQAVCSGGRSMKTGFALARATLSANPNSNGIVASRDRHRALLSKGLYRKTEKVAQEGPVGTLSTAKMPKRRDYTGEGAAARHQEAFDEWKRSALKGKVRRPSRVEVASGADCRATTDYDRVVRLSTVAGLSLIHI